MKLAYTALALAALGLAGTAQAGFVNGGFETGDFTGWTIAQGYNNGTISTTNPLSGVTFPYPGPTPTVVDKAGYTDIYFPGVQAMFVGSRMAKLNDIYGGNHVTQISQTGVIDASDMIGGATTADLYINWAGVMQNPGHSPGDNPWFVINVTKNGNPFFSETHYSADPGWTEAIPYSSVFEGSGQVHLSGLVLGDQIGVALTVADCALGGHGAYAYLDGIGTAYVPPPNGGGVPDAASTSLLLIPALFGLALLRRRF